MTAHSTSASSSRASPTAYSKEAATSAKASRHSERSASPVSRAIELCRHVPGTDPGTRVCPETRERRAWRSGAAFPGETGGEHCLVVRCDQLHVPDREAGPADQVHP